MKLQKILYLLWILIPLQANATHPIIEDAPGNQIPIPKGYPTHWDRIHVIDYFDLLRNKESPRYILKWCNGMREILRDEREELSQISTSRILTLLGQKSEHQDVREALDYYFEETDFLDLWYQEADYHFVPSRFPDRFDPQSITNLFYAHIRLGIEMPKTFRKSWYGAALYHLTAENLEDRFTPREHSSIFFNHAVLGIEIPETFQNALCENSEDLLAQFSLKVEMSKRRSRNVKNLHQTYIALEYYELDHTINPRIFKKLETKKRQSRLERDVESVLNSLNIEFESGTFMGCIAASTDFLLTQENIVIEVDGPTHFLDDQRSLKPSDLLQDELLDRAGYKVLHVPYFKWSALKGRKEKINYMKRHLARFW